MSTLAPVQHSSGDAAPTGCTLALSGVTRTYARLRALGPIYLSLDRGAVCLIEGANGAGKTTLLRLAAGLLAPTTGTRTSHGRAVYLRPGAGARTGQSVEQAVRWALAMAERDGDPMDALSLVGLEVDRLRARVGSLSAGQRARLSLALALVSRPAVACLDEPAAHLDAEGRRCAVRVVDDLRRGGCAVLMASHEPGELADFADARVRLRSGRAEVVT